MNLRSLIRGDPPVTEPIDKFRRYGFFISWVLGMVGLVSGLTVLLAPAGFVLATIGYFMFSNRGGLLDRTRIREEQSWQFRLTESRVATKFGAVLLMIIGLVWLAIGIGSLFDAT